MGNIANIKRISITLPLIEIDLRLRGRITLIGGDSSTGKSFIADKIAEQKRGAIAAKDENSLYRHIVVINYKDIVNVEGEDYNIKSKLKKINDKIIIIDNADLLLDNDTIDYINSDWNNKYIIIGRGLSRLQIMPNNKGQIRETKLNTSVTRLELVYDYSEKNWGFTG